MNKALLAIKNLNYSPTVSVTRVRQQLYFPRYSGRGE